MCILYCSDHLFKPFLSFFLFFILCRMPSGSVNLVYDHTCIICKVSHFFYKKDSGIRLHILICFSGKIRIMAVLPSWQA